MNSYFGRFCGGFFSLSRYGSGGYMIMGIGLIVVLAAVYFIFKKGSFQKSEGAESALDILKRRYVNGEIDETEYLSKKDILTK